MAFGRIRSNAWRPTVEDESMPGHEVAPAIPRRTPSKEPIQINAFEMARRGNTQLLPLFPYTGPGDIVPCCSAFQSDGSGVSIGYFVHTNDVDEVAICLGGGGARRTGDVHVGARSHGVGGGGTEAFFGVMTVTQRQREEGDQSEAVAFQCESCSTELFKYAFGGAAYEAERPGLLPSVVGGFEAARDYNAGDRKCPSCGHTNPPFPLQSWGWAQHVRATQITNLARQALAEARR
jgi:hypothetical protein